tara:strand:+ start:25680 stop:26201 length:522 start_codon:yes stop_codon:yes gene_type:complete
MVQLRHLEQLVHCQHHLRHHQNTTMPSATIYPNCEYTHYHSRQTSYISQLQSQLRPHCLCRVLQTLKMSNLSFYRKTATASAPQIRPRGSGIFLRKPQLLERRQEARVVWALLLLLREALSRKRGLGIGSLFHSIRTIPRFQMPDRLLQTVRCLDLPHAHFLALPAYPPTAGH